MKFSQAKRVSVGLVAGLVSLILIAAPTLAQPKKMTASLAIMPQSAERSDDGRLHGAYVDLIRALDRLYGTETKMIVVPFKRSVRNLVAGLADIHIPLIKIPGMDTDSLPYAFSTATLFQVAFVLYSNSDRPLEMARLNEYEILTDSAHIEFFPFKVKGTHCLPCAIKMVAAGRIDGFIFAQNEIDPYIREFKLTNVRRQLYRNFDVKILIPKGEAGKAIDHYLTEGINTLRERGEYDKLLAPVLAPYKDWQPTDKSALGG